MSLSGRIIDAMKNPRIVGICAAKTPSMCENWKTGKVIGTETAETSADGIAAVLAYLITGGTYRSLSSGTEPHIRKLLVGLGLEIGEPSFDVGVSREHVGPVCAQEITELCCDRHMR